jgi:hypothetical protein
MYCFGHNSQYKTRIESRLGALERRLQDAQMLFYVKDQIRTSWGSKMRLKFKNFPETEISAEMKISRKKNIKDGSW